MKYVLLAAAVMAAALTTTLTAGATGTPHPAQHSPGPLGLVPPMVAGKVVGGFKSPRPGQAPTTRTPQPTAADDITYGNVDQLDEGGNPGPVMHQHEVYAIYWDPSTTLPDTYQPTVDQFWNDVGHDSGKGSNVFSVETQYADGDGQISYSDSFAGSVVDTDPLPEDSASTSGAGDSTACGSYNTSLEMTALEYCVTDQEIQQEVEKVATENEWDTGPNVQYFMYTGKHIGSCFDDPTVETGHDCAYTEYCAYHSAFTDGDTSYIYANMPYPNEQFDYNGSSYTSDCAAGQYPNAHGDVSGTRWDHRAADEVINVSSHEGNEAITDPWGTGWWDDTDTSAFAGYEDGDLCAWYTPNSANLGGSAGQYTKFNQVINGHHYYIQGEWSNAGANAVGWSGCKWNYASLAPLAPTVTALPAPTGNSDTDSDAWSTEGGDPLTPNYSNPFPSVGDTISYDLGSWIGSPTSYSYSFLRCDADGNNCKTAKSGTVTAANAHLGVSYKVLPADDKFNIVLSVVATNHTGKSQPALSDLTPNFGELSWSSTVGGEPENGTSTVSGTAAKGSVLTGDVGNYDGVDGDPFWYDTNWAAWYGPYPFPITVKSYAFTWLRCDTNGNSCKTAKSGTIAVNSNNESSAITTSYTLAAADVGHTMEFQVIASNTAGKSDPAISDPTSTVLSSIVAPVHH